MIEPNMSRRSFLRRASVGVAVPVAAGVLAACSQSQAADTGTTSHDSHDMATTTPNGQMTADEMDEMHEEGIKAFVAGKETTTKGNQLMEPVMDGAVKVYNLTAAITKWEVTKGEFVDAWTYNGTMPGPMIRVIEGDTVRLVLKNDLPESTAIHPHGVMVPNTMDGVPGITQKPVKPGETFMYEFVAKNPGSHMYHSHHNSTKQVGKGLLGAFIIQPKTPRAEEQADLEYTMVLNDALGGFTINGKGFPATEPIVAKLGQKLRIRYMNEGLMIHPMHLHGLPQLVIAKDGWPQPQPWMCDTLNVAPGERWDVIVECSEPGTWAFHCHILSHAESDHGMSGMVTALIVQE